MLNFSCNLGGAFGISLAQTLRVRRDQFHQARIAGGLNPLNPIFDNTLIHLNATLGGRQHALAALYRQAQRQAEMLSYLDVFHTLMWGVMLVLPVIWFLKTAHRSAGRKA